MAGRITAGQLIKILQELKEDSPVVLWLNKEQYAFVQAVYTLHHAKGNPTDVVALSCDDEPLPTISGNGIVASAVYIAQKGLQDK